MKYTKVFLFWLVSITIVALVCALSTGFKLYAGNSKTDSLLTLLQTKIADTTRINTFNALAWELKNTNPDTAILLSTQAIALAKHLPTPINEGGGMRSKLIANSLKNLGAFHYLYGNYSQALKYYVQALKINKKSRLKHDQKEVAATLGNIGLVYNEKGDYSKALSYYFQAYEIDSILGNNSGIARHLGNIGIVYWNQGEAAKALSYYFRALEMDSVLGNKNGMTRHLGNIGNIYYDQSNFSKALSFYFRAYKIDSVLGNKIGIAIYLGNIGGIYHQQGNYPKALFYVSQAMKIDSVLGNKNGMTVHLGNLGSLYTETKNYQKAELYLKQALAMDTAIGFLHHARSTYEALTHLYSQTNRYQQAHEHHLAYQAANDSLFNEEKSKDIGREEMKFEMKMAEIKKEVSLKARALAEKEKIRKRNLFHSSIIILVLAILILSVFYSKRLTARLPDTLFHKKIDKPALARSLLYITVLLFFEIILVYMDPFTEVFTAGAPLLITIINGLIGCGIYPVYNLLEGKLERSKSQVSNSKSQAPNPKSHTYIELLLGEPVSREEERKNKDEGGSKGNIGKITPIILVSLWFSFSGQKSEDLIKISEGSHRVSHVFQFPISKTDSILQVLNSTKEDTSKINALNALAWELKYTNPDTAIILSTQALSLAELLPPSTLGEKSMVNSKLKAISFGNLGIFNTLKGDYSQALKYYKKALEINKQSDNKKAISGTLGNIGIVYDNQGDYPKALSYYFQALEIDSVLGNKMGIASKLSNIGIIYWNQSDYTKALSYYFRAIEIDSVLGNKTGIAIRFGNIGNIYYDQGDFSKALSFYFRAYEMDSILGNKNGMARHLGNIGNIYKEQSDLSLERSDIEQANRDYSKALSYYLLAYEMDSALGNKNGMARHLGNIGLLNTKTKNYRKAELYLKQSLEISIQIGYISQTMEGNKNLSELYAQTGRYKDAYQHDTLYSAIKAKLFSEEKSKDLGRVEMQHEMNVAEFIRQQEEGQRQRQLQEIVKRRNNLQYSIIVIGIFLLFGFVFFIARFTLPEWLLELSVFMPFLLLFESLLTFADPSIAAMTSGAILWKLLCNIVLAVIIEPAHNFFEKKLKERAVKMRKA